MRHLSLVLALGLVAAGCEPTYSYEGYKMADQFPTDGERYWVYQNDDQSMEEMRVEMVNTPRIADTLEVFTFEHYNDATGDLMYSIEWSSDAVKGIQIHSTTVASVGGGGGSDTGGEDTGTTPPPADFDHVFDPPILFATASMAPGDEIETETAGFTFTSKFEFSEPCPNLWADSWEDCLKVTLDDGDGDDATGVKVAGSYWLVKRYGVAWFQQTGDAEKWQLRKAEWQPDED